MRNGVKAWEFPFYDHVCANLPRLLLSKIHRFGHEKLLKPFPRAFAIYVKGHCPTQVWIPRFRGKCNFILTSRQESLGRALWPTLKARASCLRPQTSALMPQA